MRRFLTFSAAVLFMSAMAFGETFSGALLDANCASQQQQSATCNANASTTAFAIQVSGKTLKLDSNGNKKAAEALKNSSNSADRAKDPNAPSAQVMATVEGTASGDVIQVDSIQVR